MLHFIVTPLPALPPMTDPRPQTMSKPGVHLAIALVFIGALWFLGSWAVKAEKLEWAMVALVGIVFAWIYAGFAYLRWLKR